MTSVGISDKVSVRREARQHDMLMSQVNADNLKRTFQVDPDSVWLRDIDQGTAYFPDKDGNFNLKEAGVQYFQDLEVQGPNLTAASEAASGRMSSILPQGGNSTAISPRIMGPGAIIPPLLAPLPPLNPVAGSSARKKESTFSLKITKAEFGPTTPGGQDRTKHKFTPISHMYLQITEASANVTLIKAAIQRKWKEYTLVTSDGVELEDSPGIEGLAFWKAPKRKFFAVPQQNITKDSSEVDLTEEPTSKKPKLGTDVKLNEIIKSIDNLRADVSKILQVNKDMGVPVGLCNALSEVMKCKICHTIPMMPPILYAKCCKSIIGCDTCVNSWYQGEDALTKACPLCGLGRGYNETIRLMGFDGFISEVKNLFSRSPLPSENNQ